jgi:hypothetical protein
VVGFKKLRVLQGMLNSRMRRMRMWKMRMIRINDL